MTERVSDDRLACWLRHSENMQRREDEEYTIDAHVPRYYGDVAALLRELQQYRSQRCETCAFLVPLDGCRTCVLLYSSLGYALRPQNLDRCCWHRAKKEPQP